MKFLIILCLSIPFSAFAQRSNGNRNSNKDGVKVESYNKCIESEKFYQDGTGSIVKVGTGSCSPDIVPLYDDCVNGKAIVVDKKGVRVPAINKKTKVQHICTL